MTVLGKILAVLNLVLSVAVGAFIVMTYVARTNWHAAVDQLQKQVVVAREDANTYKAEADGARGEILKARDALAARDKEAKDAQASAEEQFKQESARLQTERAKSKELQTSLAAVTGENDRRQKEVAYLQQLVSQRDDQIKTMEKNVQDTRAMAVEAQIAATSTEQRNNALLDQNEKLTKQLQTAQQQGGGTPAAPGREVARNNPPPEDVEGLIKATDPQSGYLTLSIGSDAGLTKGNTLEVYRLKPEPTYLGRIEILAVRPDEAVARPVSRPRGLLQAGDRVASHIVPPR
jgi:hypothetical protein